MHKKIISLAIAGAVLSPLAFAEDAPPASPWAFTAGAVSDYLFRGVSQTHGNPAIQAGVTYTDPSGFYANLWGSNVSWVKDWSGKGSLEIDVSGGYKNTFGASKLGYDVGYYTYNYPGHGNNWQAGGIENPNTQEIYAGLTYDLGNNNSLLAKYSYATSNYFIGWVGSGAADQKTSGSDYFELDGTFDLGNGWGLTAHAGHQKVKNLSVANYTDWNVGVTKDVGFGVVGLLFSTTNAQGCGSSSGAYCWGNSGASDTSAPTGGFKNVAKNRAVLSFNKTF